EPFEKVDFLGPRQLADIFKGSLPLPTACALANRIQIGSIEFSQIAGGLHLKRRHVRIVEQQFRRRDEIMQPLVRTNAGQVSNRAHWSGDGSARAVSFELQSVRN